MKAKCIEKCQKDRKEIFEPGKVYDITEEMLKSGFFEKISEPVKTETKTVK